MPRYTLERRIGEGGMAEVFRARRDDSSGSTSCAVKRLLPELRRDAGMQQRFLDEARIASRLRHPHILPVLDVYDEGGAKHLVMDLVEGASAQACIDASVPGLFVPASVSASITLATAEALAYAHGQGVLHRDVSAGNVLLSFSGEVKLADFGLADAVGRMAATEPGSIAGNIEYLSPSRQRGEKATAMDDAFALGVLLQRLLAAADPRERASRDGQRLGLVSDQLIRPGSSAKWPGWTENLRQIRRADPAEIGAHVRQVIARTQPRYSAQRSVDAPKL